MTDVATVLSIAMLTLLWLAIAARAFIAAVQGLFPKFQPSWFARLIRRAPSWRLFGQRGAIFDLYDVIGDKLDDHDEEHFHSSYGNTRRWFHAFINPYSRYRYIHRELMQATMYRYLRERSLDPATKAAVGLLAQATRDEVRRQHVGDTRTRIAHLYIVVDRGFHARDAPEAKLSLGPFIV